MSIVENIKDAVKLIQQSDNIELSQKLLAVQTDALELIGKLHEKTEEIQQLKEELRKSQQVADIKSRANKVYNCYYEFDADEPIGGPYCPTCLDSGKISHILPKRGDVVKCPKCGVEFPDSKAVYFILNGNLDGNYVPKKIKLSEIQVEKKTRRGIRTEY